MVKKYKPIEKNDKNKTALDIAKINRNQKIITYLKNILNESNNQNNQSSQLQKE